MAKNDIQFLFDEDEILLKLFKQLPDKFQERTVVSGLKKAAKPIQDEAKSILKQHKYSGNLEHSIGTQIGKIRSLRPYVVVTPRKSRVFKGYHAHLVELGTKPGVRKTTGSFKITGADGRVHVIKQINHPGTKGIHFMKKASDRKGETTRGLIKESVAKAIQQTVNRVAKKA